ncbi:MAG: hypothetical protein JO202_10935 [Ktedonobacteraceae bacterium]|nr:hypothetical protein [Ktedonobacteraceae bacterium]
MENERKLNPLSHKELVALFDRCCDAKCESDELFRVLQKLAPCNGHIGYEQVNFLVDYLRKRVASFLYSSGHHLEDLMKHDHVFGSGGDFCKTIHASTAASILAAPLVRICKTGTTNVTSLHGSAQAMTEIGYGNLPLDINRLNKELEKFNFTFVPLSSLGFPYSNALKAARARLWNEAKEKLDAQCKEMNCEERELGWQEVIKTTDIPLDIFKIVSPNAQVLNPQHHSTGVCHLAMIPYVLGLYLHLGSEGIIVHSYDGIDEFSNAASAFSQPNNLVIHIGPDKLTFTECSPEDLGLRWARLQDIQEVEDLQSSIEDDFWRIISGEEKGPKRDFIVANAAVLVVSANLVSSTEYDLIGQLRVAVKMIEELIDSEESLKKFKALLDSRRDTIALPPPL